MTWVGGVWNGGLDPRSADPLELRRRRTVVGITTLLIPVAIAVMTLNVVVAGGTDVPGILAAMVLGVVVTVLQHRLGWSRLAGHGQTAALYFAVVMALRDTGMSDSGWAWLVAVPVIAAMAIGRDAAIGWGVISLCTLWMASVPGLFGLDPVRSVEQALSFAVETNLFMLCVTIPMVAGAEMWSRTQRSLAHSVRQLEAEVSLRTEAEARATASAAKAQIAELQARDAARIAERAGAAKATFLATMSHELRTPMNGVLGATQLLRHSRLDPEQDELVRTIEGSGEVLLNVINDILDVSRIESGRLSTEHIPVSLREVLAQVAMPLRARAAEQGVEVIVEVAPDLPDWILTDPTRLRQILFNLGGNAVKFTHAGAVQIRATRAADRLRLEIRDSGIGIRADLLSNLFEPFVQAESSTTRRFGGSGLGLAIVRGLTEALGGSVTASSEEDVGSCFVVTLPLEEAPAARTAEPTVSLAPSRALRVLVADDNPVNRMVARGLVRRLGHQVDEVTDGREAIEAVQQHHYDVVLLDVHMPNVDGLEAARAIRGLAGPERLVPLVALTADALPQHRQAALDAGMDEHLAKPVRLDDLRAALLRLTHIPADPDRIRPIAG